MSEEPTLRDIKKQLEQQLEQQKRQTKRMAYLGGAMWGGSIMVSALLLLISDLTDSSFTINCLSFLLAGTTFFLYCWRKFWRIGANEKENNRAEANT